MKYTITLRRRGYKIQKISKCVARLTQMAVYCNRVVYQSSGLLMRDYFMEYSPHKVTCKYYCCIIHKHVWPRFVLAGNYCQVLLPPYWRVKVLNTYRGHVLLGSSVLECLGWSNVFVFYFWSVLYKFMQPKTVSANQPNLLKTVDHNW